MRVGGGWAVAGWWVGGGVGVLWRGLSCRFLRREGLRTGYGVWLLAEES